MTIVALNSKLTSERTNRLVSLAEDLLKLLPWPKEFEKDKFMKPDFTCIECLSFGFAYTPLGLCLPHFDDIK
jgi:dipeptidyl-peptidase-3